MDFLEQFSAYGCQCKPFFTYLPASGQNFTNIVQNRDYCTPYLLDTGLGKWIELYIQNYTNVPDWRQFLRLFTKNTSIQSVEWFRQYYSEFGR